MRPSANYRFGSCVLDATAYRLIVDGTPVALSPKGLDLLFFFAGRPGALLTKDAILAEVWPDVAVTDNALTQVVSEIRQALGDNPASPRFVETVPRRGYRFVAQVAADAHDAAVEDVVGRAGTAGAVGGVRTIGVVAFTNVTADAELAWLSNGLAETVANALRAIRELRVYDPGLARAVGDRADVRLDVVVTGSFQRHADDLRITAQAVEARTHQALAQAKMDGPLATVFRLQDGIVDQLAAGLQLAVTPIAAARMHARETASLEAYRAVTEGRLKLETLDPTAVPAAAADFDRAIRLDPQYAVAYVGLAHACFWRFQASRLSRTPDRQALAEAIAHARRGVDLDPELAEGHAALALFLSSADRPREAVAAGRVAVALEPANWRHQFRLGVAAWGDERIACLEYVIGAYPQLDYAYFGLAMVYVARGDITRAEAVLDRGVAREIEPGLSRFPGHGLHWLRGLIRLARADVGGAVAEFQQELTRLGRGLFSQEFAMDAADGLGFARLAAGDAAGAAAMFTRALEHVPDHARSLVGLAQAEARAKRQLEADAAMARARQSIDELTAQERHAEAAMARAFAAMAVDRPDEALATLDAFLSTAPPGFAGWTIPIEPFLASLRDNPGFIAVLGKLADRAR